ncbi:MAG TPA: kelch repeat-containing protein, partial [Candidatus Angelobacter sp.]|nr:kelch repeat-containing protein [Candidatus Angelobacter sp.]
NLNVGREIHSATLLPNGMVLIAGGVGANGPLDSAELYNPATGTFSLTGTLNSERYAHTATLLNNGAVLVVGGQDYFQTSSGLTVELLRSAETFVPQLRVLTSHNDHKRTGQNTLETALTPGNIRGLGNFGKLFSQPVDGYIYAQPLYVSNLAIPGNGTHNVVFVATEGDSVYAFDADGNSGANASPLWHASLLDAAHGATAGETTVDANNDDHCGNILPQIGITSTPVIDPNTNTIYVVAKSKQPGPPVKFVYRLHALDLTTGAEKFQGPVVIQASIPGNGAGSVNGTVTFNPPTQTNRAGLLFLDGTIYIGFASTCDISPYHGWLYSYDATTLAQQGVFNTTPNTTSGSSPSGYGAGGIWMAGSGLTADSEGNIFLATGNGDFDATVGDYGDSILKFSTTGNLPTLTDYFTPTDEFALFKGDVDLGSGGVVLIPNQPGNMHLLVQAGKEGIVYVVNRDQMTSNNLHFCSGCATESMIVQELGQEQTSGKSAVGGMWGKPVYWNNTVYFWGNGDQLKAFPMSNGLLGSPLTTNEAIHGYPGESLWVSSNGTANGILWSIETDSGVEVLKAYDAVNLTPLYSSANSSTDNPGGPVKFAIPVVVNGKVYVGAQNQLSIFGSTL